MKTPIRESIPPVTGMAHTLATCAVLDPEDGKCAVVEFETDEGLRFHFTVDAPQLVRIADHFRRSALILLNPPQDE